MPQHTRPTLRSLAAELAVYLGRARARWEMLIPAASPGCTDRFRGSTYSWLCFSALACRSTGAVLPGEASSPGRGTFFAIQIMVDFPFVWLRSRRYTESECWIRGCFVQRKLLQFTCLVTALRKLATNHNKRYSIMIYGFEWKHDSYFSRFHPKYHYSTLWLLTDAKLGWQLELQRSHF